MLQLQYGEFRLYQCDCAQHQHRLILLTDNQIRIFIIIIIIIMIIIVIVIIIFNERVLTQVLEANTAAVLLIQITEQPQSSRQILRRRYHILLSNHYSRNLPDYIDQLCMQQSCLLLVNTSQAFSWSLYLDCLTVGTTVSCFWRCLFSFVEPSFQWLYRLLRFPREAFHQMTKKRGGEKSAAAKQQMKNIITVDKLHYRRMILITNQTCNLFSRKKMSTNVCV